MHVFSTLHQKLHSTVGLDVSHNKTENDTGRLCNKYHPVVCLDVQPNKTKNDTTQDGSGHRPRTESPTGFDKTIVIML